VFKDGSADMVSLDAMVSSTGTKYAQVNDQVTFIDNHDIDRFQVAGASARKSIGITVFTGMIASTCLAVLFVPSLFVVIQRFEEWQKARKAKPAQPVAAE